MQIKTKKKPIYTNVSYSDVMSISVHFLHFCGHAMSLHIDDQHTEVIWKLYIILRERNLFQLKNGFVVSN